MKQRYITKGVDTTISLQLQLLIWSLAASIPCEKDYLLVFNLTPNFENGENRQIIKVSQEVPMYETSYSFCCQDAISEKLYMIDDEDNHITLLLASEY
jgi:hypothetical protein